MKSTDETEAITCKLACAYLTAFHFAHRLTSTTNESRQKDGRSTIVCSISWAVRSVLRKCCWTRLTRVNLLQSTPNLTVLTSSFHPSERWPDDYRNFTGNMGKFGLGLVSILFDVVFMLQHYVLYPHREEPILESQRRLSNYGSSKQFPLKSNLRSDSNKGVRNPGFEASP